VIDEVTKLLGVLVELLLWLH